MKGLRFLIISLSILSLLITTGDMSQAQAPGSQGALSAASVGNAFTYQGQLKEGGSPANGAYDFQFRLYNALSEGSQVGDTVSKQDEMVANGLFQVSLDFGAVFDGTGLWLEVAVRPGSSDGEYTTLSPRQEISPAPYALYALASPWAGLSGVPIGFADGVDNNTTYTAGAGLTLSGVQFSITGTYSLPQACANGQLAEWNGSAWVCSDFTHDHLGQTWSGAPYNPGITINNSYPNGAGARFNSTCTGCNGKGVIGSANTGWGVIGNTNGGVGVFGYDTQTAAMTIGVAGSANSPAGYGGHFVNNAGGVDIMAAGSGKIMSTAETQIVASPFNLVGGANVTVIPNENGWVYLQASNTNTGGAYMPVTFPSQVFGVPQKLKSIKVCYQLDNASSYISGTDVQDLNDSAVRTYHIEDDIDRTSTTWTCYTSSDASPDPIQGAVIVGFMLNYAGTGVSHEIVIGSITLTLVEE